MDEEAEDCVVIPFILRLRIDDLSDFRSTTQERKKPGELHGTEPGENFFPCTIVLSLLPKLYHSEDVQ